MDCPHENRRKGYAMFRRNETRQPDPHALALARAMQELRPKDTVFLCGSRAAGDYREDSDIDLFVAATERKGRFDTESAAREWLREHPPDRYASAMEMDRGEFQRFIKVTQSFAGQAVRHGIAMNGEKFCWPDSLPPDDPELRQTVGMWLGLAAGHIEFLEMRRKLNWKWSRITGEEAGWALERGIKALLTALNDPVRFRHGITPMWRHLQRTLDWETPRRAELRRAMERALTLTGCDDAEEPDGRGNLLAQYIDDWRRDRVGRRHSSLEEQEQEDITDAVIEAATRLYGEACRLTDTTPEDYLARPHTAM